MTGSEAIAAMYDIPRDLDFLVADVRRECVRIETQWDALGQLGGQRDDHAARYLAGLREKLEKVLAFGQAIREEILAIEQNPFGEE